MNSDDRLHPSALVPLADEADMTCQTPTILHRLQEHARNMPERIAFQQVGRNLNVTDSICYGELWRRVRVSATAMRPLGAPGCRVLIFIGPGLDSLVVFLGILMARMIAVPAPVVSLSALEKRPNQQMLRRYENLRHLVADCAPELVLVPVAHQPSMEAFFVDMPCPPVIRNHGEICSGMAEAEVSSQEMMPSDKEVAFLQYTSGSTSMPKGVVVTHANLMHNQQCISLFVRTHRESVMVSWLPLFHDMGLVGDALHTIWAGARCVRLQASEFIRRPDLWMRTVSKFGGTVTGGPNFAFQLAAQHAPKEPGLLNLSTLEVAYCGSEPVRPAVLEAFATAYQPSGFKSEALTPCYGLAESTLLVTGCKAAEVPPRFFTPQAMYDGATFVHGKNRTRMISCGKTARSDVRLFIIDPVSGEELPAGAVGEIRVCSRSVSPGYWDELKNVQRAGFLDEPRLLATGDLGFLHGGELFVCGRIKNTLIVRGRKFVAEDVESLIESSLPHVERVRAAVFPVDSEKAESVVVLVEGEFSIAGGMERERELIQQSLGESFGFIPRHIELLQPASLPRTTSGKLQRAAAAALWESSLLRKTLQ